MACGSQTTCSNCATGCNDNSNLLFFILALTALNGKNGCDCSGNNNNTIVFCLLLCLLLGNSPFLSSGCNSCSNG